MSSESKTIVVTGVTRGLGRALVDRFAAAGHTVIGCGRSEEPIAELQQQHPSPHSFTALDIRRGSAVETWASGELKGGTAPDLLINNAGLINRSAPLWRVAEDEFDAVIDVNLKGSVNVIRAWLPAMIERGSGLVVNLSSGWGRSVAPEVAPYCASKWGIEGLTAALALELPPGLGAVAVNPGIIDTEMLRSCFGGSAGSYPDPEAWARRAAEFFLNLGVEHNGSSLNAP